MIGLMTDHSSAAALFAFSNATGVYQTFGCVARPPAFPKCTRLMPLGHALKQLLEWLSAPRHPQSMVPMAGVPQHESEGEEDGQGDPEPAKKMRNLSGAASSVQPSGGSTSSSAAAGASATGGSGAGGSSGGGPSDYATLAARILKATGGCIHVPLSRIANNGECQWKQHLPPRFLHMLEKEETSAAAATAATGSGGDGL